MADFSDDPADEFYERNIGASHKERFDRRRRQNEAWQRLSEDERKSILANRAKLAEWRRRAAERSIRNPAFADGFSLGFGVGLVVCVAVFYFFVM